MMATRNKLADVSPWFSRLAWVTLAYTALVGLWGGYVRATGSGAGCGAHWPLCNGEVIPRPESLATWIEFSHRLSSGLDLILVAVLAIWAWRIFPRGHLVRLGAGLSSFFIITEALLGAGLVLFELVAQDASLTRAFSMALHLLNTFLLLASLALTAFWATGFVGPRQKPSWLLLVGAVGILLAGISGAVAALGDTLFPATSLATGLNQTWQEASHVFLRLRAFHPLLAVVFGIWVALTALKFLGRPAPLGPLAIGVLTLVGLQIAAGLINLVLLAPIPMQITHLALAYSLWITQVLLIDASASEVTIGDEIPSPAHY